MTERESFQLMRQDLVAQAKTLSALTERMLHFEEFRNDTSVDLARREERAKRVDERLTELQASIKALSESIDERFAILTRLGWALLTMLLSVLGSVLAAWFTGGFGGAT